MWVMNQRLGCQFSKSASNWRENVLLPRIKNNAFGLALSLLFAFGMVLSTAQQAHAQNNPYVVTTNSVQDIMRGATGPICSAYVDPVTGVVTQLSGLTARFVLCIQGTVIWALQRYLGNFVDDYIINLINVMCAFAVLLYGFMVSTGRAQGASREGVILALKIGIVVWLVNKSAFSAIFPAIIGSIDWLLALVTEYTAVQFSGLCPYSPFIWNRVDCALNLLIGGILPGTTIFSGFIGFVAAMLFSSGIGVAVFFFGIGIIIALLKTIFQAMFILISAYIALALLALLAPLMIPLILFRATKAYFEKWLRMMIGVILQPLFLFTYMTIFLIALDVSLFTGQFSVYRSITCGATIPVGNYIWSSGAVSERSGPSALFSMNISQRPRNFEGTPQGTQSAFGGPVGNEAVKQVADPKKPFSVGSFFNMDLTALALDIGQLAANCNVSPLLYFVRLVLSLFTAMAVIYIFSTMLQFIPYLGTLISSDLFGLPNLMNAFPMDKMTGHNLGKKLGFIK
jgi:type IV secretory pathway VirB6-like protein